MWIGKGPSWSLFFEKKKTNKKNLFRYGLGEYVYQISGMYRFSFGQSHTDQHIYVDFDIFNLNFLICGKAIEKMCGNPCDGPVHSDQQPSRSLFRRINEYSRGDMWKFT